MPAADGLTHSLVCCLLLPLACDSVLRGSCKGVPRQTIAHLQRSLARLSKAALALLSRDPQLQRRLQLLDSPEGMTALAVLGELVVIGERWARELTKHASLDEVEFTSGSSVQEKPHISHAGITSASFSSLSIRALIRNCRENEVFR